MASRSPKLDKHSLSPGTSTDRDVNWATKSEVAGPSSGHSVT